MALPARDPERHFRRTLDGRRIFAERYLVPDKDVATIDLILSGAGTFTGIVTSIASIVLRKVLQSDFWWLSFLLVIPVHFLVLASVTRGLPVVEVSPTELVPIVPGSMPWSDTLTAGRAGLLLRLLFLIGSTGLLVYAALRSTGLVSWGVSFLSGFMAYLAVRTALHAWGRNDGKSQGS